MVKAICICTGIQRSGSTWSFNVCRLLTEAIAVHNHQPMFCAFLEESHLDHFVLKEAPVLKGPAVIKTHRVHRIAFDFIHSGSAKAVCTFRDPRDCVVSLMTFVDGEVEELTKRMVEALKRFNLYKMSPNTLFVRYEQMMINPEQEIRRIAAHMNVPVNDEGVRWINSQTNLEVTRQICEDLKQRPGSEIREHGTHRVDPLTYLHDNHIFSGKSGRWRVELTSEQAQEMTHAFRPWLLSMGYETRDSLAALEDVWRSVSADMEHAMPVNSQAYQTQMSQPGVPAQSM